MIVGLTGRCPVTVHVDTETGEVVRVFCFDSEHEFAADDVFPSAFDVDTFAAVSKSTAKRARAIAEDAVWPSWEWQ